ncbi:MAG: FtsP/CotA-like multicopper oxidase with cupredoxin domain, partial [Myxococcota bacterium]
MRIGTLVLAALLTVACSDTSDDPGPESLPDILSPGDSSAVDVPDTDVPIQDVSDAADATDEGEPPDAPLPVPEVIDNHVTIVVVATLDGEPIAGALALQAGAEEAAVKTDSTGRATVVVDLNVPGNALVAVSHPAARIGLAPIYLGTLEAEYPVALKRFSTKDNQNYPYAPAGSPGKANSTEFCGHCHVTILADWWDSSHRQSASNPLVHDLYSGAAAAFNSEVVCTEQGGAWLPGLIPGTGDAGHRCYLGGGVLPDLNPDCAPNCDTEAENFGACADCHAPTIHGELGGRDLLDATGNAYQYGVQCESCHRTESIDETGEAGVAGRLKIIRPSEPSPSPTLGVWAPLTFGPSHDSVNFRMGSVQRDHFHEAILCSGCHEQKQKVLVPGEVADPERWPDGRLPIHTTFSEWEAGPMRDSAPCQACHMPPNPMVTNGSDQQIFEAASIGSVAGYIRPPGSINHHTWDGPRAVDSGMLALAATLEIDATVSDQELLVDVTTRNSGPGHAIPTGEPMRSLVMTIEASCDGVAQAASGGDPIPDFGGYRDVQNTGGDWLSWPGAQVGDVIRVVARPGGWRQYAGVPPFDDTFTAEQKGMPQEVLVGESEVTEVAGDLVTLSAPLPAGDRAYRVGEGDFAGAAGFAFAKVLVDAEGTLMTPHYRAVDVVSDNRLRPQTEWVSSHAFAVDCADPTVTAVLWHRAYPPALARLRGWPLRDTEMTRTRVTVGQDTDAPGVEPPAPTELPKVVEIELTAAEHAWEAGGNSVQGYAYNGQVPGPEIRARVGDTVRITLNNALDDPTTIHWHGVHVPWAMDGVTWMADPVAPGDTFIYEFTLTQAGTYWYHPHFNTARQVDLGLYGALIVEDPVDPIPDTDLVLIFDGADEFRPGDGTSDKEGGHAHPGSRMVRQWLVNGQSVPDFSFKGGTWVRARFINTSNAGYLDLRMPSLEHIASEQGRLPSLQTPDRLVLGPGDRADVQWRIGSQGFEVQTAPYTLDGGAALSPSDAPWSAVQTLLTVSVVAPAEAPGNPSFVWSGRAPTPDPDHTDIVYTLAGSDYEGRWLINGETFPDVTIETIALGQQAIIEVRNLSPTEHPFHLHGHAFEVISLDGEAPPHYMLEDTLNIPIRQTARLRLLA